MNPTILILPIETLSPTVMLDENSKLILSIFGCLINGFDEIVKVVLYLMYIIEDYDILTRIILMGEKKLVKRILLK